MKKFNKKGKIFKENLKILSIKLARDPDKLIIIPEDEHDYKEADIKISSKNTIKEPAGIPQPIKTPEINPLSDPATPNKYPEEIPTNPSFPNPIEQPPYIIPKPPEYP